MNLRNRKIEHPAVAFLVIVAISAMLNLYGVTGGSLMLFDLFAGIAIYKFLTAK